MTIEQKEKYDNKTTEVDENFKMCYKLVTGKEVKSNDDFSEKTIDALLNVFESFKTSSPIKFRKLNLDENTKIFIEKLIDTDDDYITLHYY